LLTVTILSRRTRVGDEEGMIAYNKRDGMGWNGMMKISD
jgi:hypothetical protein